MKKNQVFSFLFLASGFLMSNAFAGNGTGKVGSIFVQTPHYVLFSVGEHKGVPPCQGGSDNFAIDIETELGQAQYALLMMAKGLDKTVTVVGDTGCNAWPDRESVNYMFTTD